MSNTLNEVQQNQINDIIRRHLEDPHLQFEPSRTFEELGCDSLDFAEITMALEDELDIEMMTEDLDKVTTVSELYEYMATRHATTFQIHSSTTEVGI